MTALESVISKGGRVAEKDIVNFIELLMNELIKLDGIVADGDVKLQRKMQVNPWRPVWLVEPNNGNENDL